MPRRRRPNRTQQTRLRHGRGRIQRRSVRHRTLRTERLEDRNLLAVTFEFNFLGGTSVGFNDPIMGGAYQAALEAAATRLGNDILHDATIEVDVSSNTFNGTTLGTSTSNVGPFVPEGGFVHRVVPSKILGEGDLNGSETDATMTIYFFSGSDPYTYILDPAESDEPGEIDFQAVMYHELVHMLGFTSNTHSNGRDDSGNGITTPGTWAPYDRFLSDLNGNRFINADTSSPFVYLMDFTQWNAHSTGGAGPNAGLFFDGPTAKAVYGNRVPLYSPATFSLSSSVSHLDCENYPNGNHVFSPRTHPMCHVAVTGASPQGLTLVEKAILADTGMMLREDVPPTITAPRNITVEANTTGGFTGTNQDILDFLAEATAEDVFDPNPVIENDKPETLSLGANSISFTATDLSGNTATTTALITVSDTTAPSFSLSPTLAIHANTPMGADLQHPDLLELILLNASDVADDTLSVTADTELFPIGDSVVTFTVTDDSGNSSQASTTLTVTDESLVVTTLEDELDADPENNPTDLSLREAIELANQNPDFTLIQIASSLNGTIAINELLGSLSITASSGLYGLGATATIVDAQGHSRVLDISGSQTSVFLDGLTISGGETEAGGEGGAGIRFNSPNKLSIHASHIIDNTTSGDGATGAGIQMQQGDLWITDSWINSNLTAGATAGGGGIWSQASVAIRSSTVSGNSTEGIDARGAGIQLQGGRLEMVNATVSGNDTLDADGAGIHGAGTDIAIKNSTIVNNIASDVGGGIAMPAGGSAILTIRNSVIAQNTDNGTSPDFTGTGILLQSDAVTYSLIGDNAGTTLTESQTAHPSTGNLVGDATGAGVIDPLLLALSDHGGPTPTQPPEPNSPLIDAGAPDFSPDDFVPALEYDQRGDPFARVRTRLDIGAVETLIPLLIDWPTPEDIAVGTPLTATQLNATANISGTFEYTPPAGTVLGLGANQLLSATFTPDNQELYSPTDTTVTINVTSSTPSLSWNTPADIVYGTALNATQLNATANVSGEFVYTPPAGTELDAGPTQVLQVTFNPDDTAFESVSTSVTINVLKATPAITWNDPADIAVGTPLTGIQLNATSPVPGSFNYTPDFGAILESGNNQLLTTSFTPDDTDNYENSTAQVTIDVIDTQDYGDAPAIYPVTLADNGARHLIGSLRLGTTVDDESDGQASSDASADGNDDDGILQLSDAITLATSDSRSSFEILASGTGKLDAWIDFNGDGDWTDPNEQIAVNFDVTAGSNLLSYVIPSGSTVGQTAARFRLSSSGGLAPTGAASDGEVEDYMITLVDGSNPQDINIDLAGSENSIFVDDAQFVAAIQSAEILRIDINTLSTLTLTGRDNDQTLTLNVDDITSITASSMTVHGGGGSNRIQLLGESASLDLTDPAIAVEQFQTLDLTGSVSQIITLDGDTIVSMNPDNKEVTVLTADGDQLRFNDLSEWNLEPATLTADTFLQTALHQTNSSIIHVDSASPWQNFLRPSDINGDNQVTTLDALIVINEIARRAYSDENTSALFDPIALGNFPDLYFDQTGDGLITTFDALQVLNHLARNSGEGEFAGIFHDLAAANANANAGAHVHHSRVSRHQSHVQSRVASFQEARQWESIEREKREDENAESVDQLLADLGFMAQLGIR